MGELDLHYLAPTLHMHSFIFSHFHGSASYIQIINGIKNLTPIGFFAPWIQRFDKNLFSLKFLLNIQAIFFQYFSMSASESWTKLHHLIQISS